MSFEDDVALIEGYTKWIAQRRIEAKDDSPAQYLAEKTRSEAFERLQATRAYVGDPVSWAGRGITDTELVEYMTALVRIMEGKDD